MSLSTDNLIVLAKIITAVESGGQVYGKGSYDSVVMPYTNSKLEHTITLGAGQFYGSEAKALIKMIFTVYPTAFRNADTASPSIESMLNTDWVATRWSPNDSQVNALRAIISSEAGKACQDTLLAEQMAAYVLECEKYYPRAGDKAKMMFTEIRHLGGLSAAKRIFNRLSEYDLDSIMTALKKDQDDTSSNNQVGDKKYWSRHEKCYEFINKYYVSNDGAASANANNSAASSSANDSTTSPVTAILDIARAEIGYLEKKNSTAKYLDSKTENAGSNNITKYWRDILPSYQGSQWCACFVSWCMYKAFGKDKAKKLLSNVWVWTYCPDLGNAGAKRLYSKPQPGDVILFWKNRGSEGGWRFGHTGIVESATDTTVTTIEGNTSGGSTVVANGGGVFRKTYKLSNLQEKTRYYRPNYSGIVGGSLSGSSDSGSVDYSTGYPWIGEVTADALYVRKGPGKEYATSAYYPVLKKGDRVEVHGKENGFYYIKITNATVKQRAGKDSIYDYASAKYITRV